MKIEDVKVGMRVRLLVDVRQELSEDDPGEIIAKAGDIAKVKRIVREKNRETCVLIDLDGGMFFTLSEIEPAPRIVWAMLWPDGRILADSEFESEARTWEVGLGWPHPDDIEVAKANGVRVCQVEIREIEKV